MNNTKYNSRLQGPQSRCIDHNDKRSATCLSVHGANGNNSAPPHLVKYLNEQSVLIFLITGLLLTTHSAQPPRRGVLRVFQQRITHEGLGYSESHVYIKQKQTDSQVYKTAVWLTEYKQTDLWMYRMQAVCI